MSYEHFEGRSSPEIASDDRAALQRFPATYRSNRIRDHSRAALDLTASIDEYFAMQLYQQHSSRADEVFWQVMGLGRAEWKSPRPRI